MKMNIYEGNENYIFVSYAHADSNRVMPILKALDREGFRLWFDSGIEAGSEWPAYIADHIRFCHRMIFFVSKASVNSKNCRREVNFADSLNKEILVAYLEDAKLQHGLDLQLAANQAVSRDKYISDAMFINAIAQAKMLFSCKSNYVVDAKHPVKDEIIDSDDEEFDRIMEGFRNDPLHPSLSSKNRRIAQRKKRAVLNLSLMICYTLLGLIIGLSIYSWRIGLWLIAPSIAIIIIIVRLIYLKSMTYRSY